MGTGTGTGAGGTERAAEADGDGNGIFDGAPDGEELTGSGLGEGELPRERVGEALKLCDEEGLEDAVCEGVRVGDLVELDECECDGVSL